MELRTLVTFRSNKFNTSEIKSNYINPCCFGGDVAQWLVQQLTSSGVAVEPKIGQEDFGWYLGFQCGSYRYHFVLGYNPDGFWMGWLERQRGLLGRFFGARKKEIQLDAANAIHSILASSGIVSNVRWHLEKDFDALGEDSGTRAPVA